MKESVTRNNIQLQLQFSLMESMFLKSFFDRHSTKIETKVCSDEESKQ